MRLSVIRLNGEMWWRSAPDGPLRWPLASLPGYELLDPVRIQLPKSSHQFAREPVRAVGFVGHELVVTTDILLLAGPDNSKDGMGSDVFEKVARFLAALRDVSKQATLPLSMMFAMSGGDVPAPSDFPAPAPDGEGKVRGDYVAAAVAAQHIALADALAMGGGPEVYRILLLDAMAAKHEGDHRRSLLYSAMSVEVGGWTRLDRHMQSVVAAPTDRHRVVTLQATAGTTIVKDPIFSYLKDRVNFPQLLHEVSLYAFGRSLLVEDQSLYQDAQKLFRTRNKIAHLGSPPATHEYLSLESRGSQQGILTAIGVLKWLGDDDVKSIPASTTLVPFVPLMYS